MAVGLGLLDTIDSPDDVKRLGPGQLTELCGEIRETLVRYGHLHGGHIGSNLGVVEATVALHAVFDSPRDRIVFDVSHQSYVHKMLTGRRLAYTDPARFAEVTGFTNPEESGHDQFVLGHTGTSISLACGLAKTRDMTGGAGNVVAMIGDGSLSSGVAFEGLNNAAEQGGNLIIVFNDNEMSIAGDFGGMYGPLARLRASNGTAQPNIFNAFGLDYRYVADGNDVNALVVAFREVKDTDHPVVVHIHTMKGLGLDAGSGKDAHAGASNTSHAEPWHSDHCNLSDAHAHAGQCEANHWLNPDSALGRPDDPRKHYGKLAMAALEKRFPAEPGLTVVVPATPGSNGITHAFRERAGAHYVDTGITESHAVAYAAGIAKAGGRPVVATTASFFQRAYDQFFQEAALNRTRVTILDFLGGLSGSDNTHSGAYDLTMFANIPGLTVLLPTSRDDFLADLAWATAPEGAVPGTHADGPVVIRVPGSPILDAERAGVELPRWCPSGHGTAAVSPLDWRVTRRGSRVAILGLGNAYPLAARVADALGAELGGDVTLIDPHQCSSLDETALESLRGGHELVVTLEDGQLEGGWGEKVTAYYANRRDERDAARNPRVINAGATKEFTDRVSLPDLCERYGLTEDALLARIRRELARGSDF
ncbi:1-deoxy-D-xylulose-5-phosphate synthase [Bifidobacterium avesanii]|uniref:1-deoxy-D-xylulose-5-phosphate synthase n=1 Tax=Bifidobacterium avesanii TaxID=1798157 RepID=A0A7K3TFT0_9BIFI|nr:1-deoxy-D-xylulose-5-phosphate synthase [Bifidobacterium avesanii]KAB8291466.1 1-deoxy-D-xylulose-5-phosphate synthase [Bifidobacterium avesanii]NEG77902.1 1-deoxy-D-xylulose-5-phosphate synthase [Bifidobacterium avesanii]